MHLSPVGEKSLGCQVEIAESTPCKFFQSSENEESVFGLAPSSQLAEHDPSIFWLNIVLVGIAPHVFGILPHN